jgi:hypothetical protein
MHPFASPVQRGLADVDLSRLESALRHVSLPALPTSADVESPAGTKTKQHKPKRGAPIVTRQTNGLAADYGIYTAQIDAAGNMTGTTEKGEWIVQSVRRLEDPPNQNIASFQVDVSLPKIFEHALGVFESQASPLYARHVARQLLVAIRQLLSLTASGSTHPVIELAVLVGQLYERLQVAGVQDAALTAKRGKSGRQKGGKATADPKLWNRRAQAVKAEFDRQARCGDKRSYPQACAVVAADEVNKEHGSASLKGEELAKARRIRAKHLKEELCKRYPELTVH